MRKTNSRNHVSKWEIRRKTASESSLPKNTHPGFEPTIYSWSPLLPARAPSHINRLTRWNTRTSRWKHPFRNFGSVRTLNRTSGLLKMLCSVWKCIRRGYLYYRDFEETFANLKMTKRFTKCSSNCHWQQITQYVESMAHARHIAHYYQLQLPSLATFPT